MKPRIRSKRKLLTPKTILADCGLLSAELAAGIRRVKGVKKLGVRHCNGLTADQSQATWQAPDRDRIKGKMR
jgi:hypothetical protein